MVRKAFVEVVTLEGKVRVCLLGHGFIMLNGDSGEDISVDLHFLENNSSGCQCDKIQARDANVASK